MQIAEDGEFIRETESNYSALRARIRQTQLALDRAQGVLRIKVRDIETLKVHDLREGGSPPSLTFCLGRA